MLVTIAGGHGQIAQHLTQRLTQRGHQVRSVIRKVDQSDDIRELGAVPILVDLEATTAANLADALGDADAVVFAAGAGPGSGAERKETVDHLAAGTLAEAAALRHVGHYVMISSMGADATHEGDQVFDAYLRAKGRAEDDLRASGLGYTIVRPTSLSNDEPAGTVSLSESADGSAIARADVAEVLSRLLEDGRPLGRTLQLTAGSTPVAQAVESLQR